MAKTKRQPVAQSSLAVAFDGSLIVVLAGKKRDDLVAALETRGVHIGDADWGKVWAMDQLVWLVDSTQARLCGDATIYYADYREGKNTDGFKPNGKLPNFR
jgi:hypothetical protein